MPSRWHLLALIGGNRERENWSIAMTRTRPSTWRYFALVYGLSWPCWIAAALRGQQEPTLRVTLLHYAGRASPALAGIVLIYFSLLLAGCAAQPVTGSGGVEHPPNIRYLALGDSYTIGESVKEAERWPVQLAEALRKQGVGVAEPLIIAQTGWTTDELLAGMQQVNPAGTFELVSLLIGVNNQYRGRDVGEYRTQFRVLLQRAIGFAGGHADRVIVLSIPDWGVTPFAAGRDSRQIAAEIDSFNAVNREEAEKAGARYVDVTPTSRRAAAEAALIAADGLHPSGEMYAEWVRLALPEALAALGRTNL
jgi:lysophospholipase L1-like esterase